MTVFRSSGKFAWRQLKQTWRMVFVTQNRRRPPTSQEKQGTWQATLFRYKLACIGIWDFGHIPQPYSTICKQHSVDCIPSPRPNSLLIQPSLNQFFSSGSLHYSLRNESKNIQEMWERKFLDPSLTLDPHQKLMGGLIIIPSLEEICSVGFV